MQIRRPRHHAVLALVAACAASSAGAGEVLSNGLRTWSVASGDPSRFSLVVIVGTGARDEPREKRGISHALEHAVFLGTEALGPSALLAEMRHRGVSMNGQTSSDLTTYEFDVPVAHATWLIETVGEMISRPPLRPEEVDSEIEVVLEELSGRGADMVTSSIDTELYGREGLGSSPGGTSRSVRGLDADDLRAWHSVRYRASDMLVAWAAVEPSQAELADIVRRSFEAVPPGSAEPARTPTRTRQGSWTLRGFSESAGGGRSRPGAVISGHHVRSASPTTFAALLVEERLLRDACFEAMRADRPLAYFTSVSFEAATDARRLEFSGRVRDEGKLEGLVDALAVARARALDADDATFEAARAAVLSEISAPESGSQLERIARLEFLAGHASAEPRLASATASLTRDETRRVVEAELVEPNAYVMASRSIRRTSSHDAKRLALVVATLLGVVVALVLARPVIRRVRFWCWDATAALRHRFTGRAERDRMDAQVQDFLRSAGKRRPPPGGNDAGS